MAKDGKDSPNFSGIAKILENSDKITYVELPKKPYQHRKTKEIRYMDTFTAAMHNINFNINQATIDYQLFGQCYVNSKEKPKTWVLIEETPEIKLLYGSKSDS